MAKFEEAYERLNEEQRRAVDTIKGPVMVIAGPGTGKTEVLTVRIANILRTAHIAPERILALTFTEAGAATMRRRLADLVGRDAYRVTISTFHGFANGVIRDYPDYFPEIIGASDIAEIDQVRVMERVIDGLSSDALRPFNEKYHYLKPLLRAVSDLKQQGVSPVAFHKIVEEARANFLATSDLINDSGKYEGKMKTKYLSLDKRTARNLEVAGAYTAYEDALRKAKQYDYNDMIMKVAAAFKTNEDMRRTLQDAYDYFLVDEHQDTNNAQNAIIEEIAGGKDEPNLFVVGDEKQAIYRFQGASIENFHYLKTRYPGAKLIALRNNYRSTQAILNAADAVSPRKEQLVAQTKKDEVPAHFAELSTPTTECYFVAEKIKALLQDGKEKPEEIAVLYRDNRDAASFVRVFEKENIPFMVESDSNALEDDDVRKLVRLLRAVEHFGNSAEVAAALHVDFLGIPPLDVYKLLIFARREKIKNLYEIGRSKALLLQAGLESPDICFAFFQNLSKWKQDAENRGAATAFENIVRESGFLAAILNHPSAMEKLAKLHAIFDILKSFIERKKDYTLREFFEYLDLMELHGVVVKSRAVRLPGRVRLMTAHRAKGQEFDVVFVVNAVARKWGGRFHRDEIKLPSLVYSAGGEEVLEDEEDNDADERNVFYVAITRARRELWITASRVNSDGREQVPTKFVSDLDLDVLSRFSVNEFEEAFALRSDVEFSPAPAKGPELKDKEFLNALFEEQGLSPTALNNYLACPWQYFYRNLVRVPEAPNKSLAFGTAVHAALRSYFDFLDAGEDKGKDYFIRRFEEEIAHQAIPQDEYDDALARGRNVLAAYYAAYHDTWGAKGKNEVTIDGVLCDDVKLNGKLDRIVFMPNPNVVNVIDYKTGQPKTRNELEGVTKDANGDYKRQLTFYKLLLEKQGTYVMQEGVIDFIQADARGKFHRESFDISNGEVRVLEAQIAQVAKEIRELSFWDKPVDDLKCEYCALRRMMK